MFRLFKSIGQVPFLKSSTDKIYLREFSLTLITLLMKGKCEKPEKNRTSHLQETVRKGQTIMPMAELVLYFGGKCTLFRPFSFSQM